MKKLAALLVAFAATVASASLSLGNPVVLASLGNDTPFSGCVFYAPLDSITNTFGNNFTVNGGVTFTAGKVGNAANFDGGDSYLTAATSYSFTAATNAQTIEFWAKFELSSGRYFFLGNDGGNWLPGVLTPTKVVSLFTYGDGFNYGSYNYTTPTTPANGQWHHYAFTINSGFISGNKQQKVYLDGSLMAIISGDGVYLTAGSSPISTDFTTFVLGKESLLGEEYYTGQLDELAIYNRELSASEIQTIYQNNGNVTRTP